MAQWRARDPVVRFRNWLAAQGWWDEAREVELRRALRSEVVGALEAASKVAKPPLSDMFTDVYAAAGGGTKMTLALAPPSRRPRICSARVVRRASRGQPARSRRA